jgi:hypothetical protein
LEHSGAIGAVASNRCFWVMHEVLPDTLDEHGDDALDGDEAEHLVFIDVVVRVETGAPR